MSLISETFSMNFRVQRWRWCSRLCTDACFLLDCKGCALNDWWARTGTDHETGSCMNWTSRTADEGDAVIRWSKKTTNTNLANLYGTSASWTITIKGSWINLDQFVIFCIFHGVVLSCMEPYQKCICTDYTSLDRVSSEIWNIFE